MLSGILRLGFEDTGMFAWIGGGVRGFTEMFAWMNGGVRREDSLDI
jgi:hypothetical protein